MCIAIVSNSHKDYPLILLSNRDEFLQRPTSAAAWWSPPHQHVLGGRDQLRAEQGTWLGITAQGRLACLTNFREEGQALIEGRRSRGVVVNSYLKTPPDSQATPTDAARGLIAEGVDGIGGFSLLFGRLKGGEKGEGLAIVSNRSVDVEELTWILRGEGETHALSNAHFGDKSWPKVVDGEALVKEAIRDAVDAGDDKDALIQRFLGVLSRDTMPRQKHGEPFDAYMRKLRQSIFIPAISDINQEKKTAFEHVAAAPNGTPNRTPPPVIIGAAMSGVYGTQKQSVILVDRQGMVTFFERTVFDARGKTVPVGKGDRQFEFEIEGW